jgi:biopolymer transport protein ExbD
LPIQFRCTTCNQLLSISRKKAGVEILCPKCTTLTRVPQLESAGDDEPVVEKPAPPKADSKPPQVPAEKAPPAPRRDVAQARPAVEQRPASPAPQIESPRSAPAPAEQRVIEELDAIDGLITSEVQDDAHAFLHATHGGLSSPVPSLPYNPWTDVDHDEDDFHPMRRQHPPKDELDMTSLVDVTFLLLVFFMITASFTVQKFLQIAAPESDDNAAAATAVVANDDIVGESVVVEIDAEDRIQVDDAPVAGLAELKELFKRKLRDEQKTDVLIEAAYKATHGTVVAVTDMAMQAEMRHVRRASRRDADD